MKHVDAAVLLDLVEQRLSQAECEAHQQHVNDCRRCSGEYEYWWTFFSTLGPPQLMDAPKGLIDECIDIMPKSTLRFEIATVLVDSLLQPLPAFGVRGAAVTSRQLVMRVEGLDVHVRISGRECSRTIHGQLLPLTSSRLIDGAQIELRVAGQPAQFTYSNTLGEFRFTDVPAGSFTFIIDLLSEGKFGQFSVHGG